ncbi:YajG family lipoprotein [Desulfobacterota bacterium AH_259_B03_O07]|nr:YajG family lipoprotein [Desulfobacterota bacterium AH_259_B03_O07]
MNAIDMKIIVLVFFGLLAGSCAFGTRHVTLSYPPKADMESTTASDAVASVLEPGLRRAIILFQFKDLRLNKSRIGDVQNAYGTKTADVVAENNVTEWLNNAIIIGLEEAGYNVIKREEISNTKSIPVLKGEILRVYVTAYFTYEAEVSIAAELEIDNKLIMFKSYNGKGGAGMNWAMTADSAGESLSLALADAIRKLVNDINNMNLDLELKNK